MSLVQKIRERFSRLGLWGQRAALAALGAVVGLGQAPFDLPGIMFVGLVVLLLLQPAAGTWRECFGRGWFFGLGYFALCLHWIVEPFLIDIAAHGWMAPFALILLAGGLALLWGVAFGLAALMGRGRYLIVLFVLFEWLRAHLFTGFPWALISYAWIESPVYQLAAWIGPYGLLFLVLLAANACAIALQRRFVILGVFGVLAAVAVSSLGTGGAPENADRPLVRIVQPNAPQHQKWDPEFFQTFYGRQIAATEAEPKVALTVWPESAIPTLFEDAGGAFARISQAARGAPVVLGINRLEGNIPRNSLTVLGTDGHPTGLYDKAHLVPFGEYIPLGHLLTQFGIGGRVRGGPMGFGAGPGPALLDIEGLGRAQPLICYEGIFPHDVGATSERPDFLILITNDAWFGEFSGPYQHLRQAQARAIEQGLPMIRSANTGVSAMIGPKGRIIDSLPLGVSGHIDANLPKALPETLYARLGDLPAIVLLLVFVAGLSIRPRQISN